MVSNRKLDVAQSGLLKASLQSMSSEGSHLERGRAIQVYSACCFV